MNCWYCNHLLNVPSAPPKSIRRINDAIKTSEQDITCIYCGAEYHLQLTGSKPPKISEQQLAVVLNDVRHPIKPQHKR